MWPQRAEPLEVNGELGPSCLMSACAAATRRWLALAALALLAWHRRRLWRKRARSQLHVYTRGVAGGAQGVGPLPGTHRLGLVPGGMWPPMSAGPCHTPPAWARPGPGGLLPPDNGAAVAAA